MTRNYKSRMFCVVKVHAAKIQKDTNGFSDKIAFYA